MEKIGQTLADNSSPEIKEDISQYFLVVLYPNSFPEIQKLISSYHYRVPKDIIEASEIVPNYDGPALITDNTALARKAAEYGKKIVLIEYNIKQVVKQSFEKNNNAHLFDLKNEDVTKVKTTLDDILSNYNKKLLKKILIVEDELNQFLLYKLELEDAGYTKDKGYEIFEASSPEEALTKIERDKFNLIITDYNFKFSNSNYTGLDLLGKVRIEHPEIPIIFQTGDHFSTLEIAEKFGAFAALTKSSNLSELIKNVGNAIDSKGQSKTPFSDSSVEDYIKSCILGIKIEKKDKIEKPA